MYATVADLTVRIGASVFAELYPASATAEADLESASAEIDGSVSVRYALPVTGARTAALLKDWNLTLAQERAGARAAGSAIAAKVKDAAAQVRLYLEMVRTGAFRFPDAAERSGASLSFIKCARPVFGRDRMEGL